MERKQQITISLNLLLNCISRLDCFLIKTKKIESIIHELKILYSTMFDLFREEIKLYDEIDNQYKDERMKTNVN